MEKGPPAGVILEETKKNPAEGLARKVNRPGTETNIKRI
jgi:hypothetical protein